MQAAEQACAVPRGLRPPTLKPATPSPRQVLELDPGNAIAQKMVQRLAPVVEERREKLKEEMMGGWLGLHWGAAGAVGPLHVCAVGPLRGGEQQARLEEEMVGGWLTLLCRCPRMGPGMLL